MVPVCTGNDTGGSLRIPSSFCGTTALRPTQGAVPYERRLFAHSTFQTQGPMARSVEDTQLLFTVMARPHPIDPMSTALQDEWPMMPDLSKLRVAVSADLGFAPTRPEIRACFEKKVALFGTQFATCDWIVPPLGSAADVSWILRALQHVTQFKERYEAHRDRLGALVVRYFEEGLRVSVQDIGWAKAEQMRLHQLMADFLAQYDFLVCPCVAVPPFPVEELFPKALDGLIPDAFIRWAGLTNGLAVLDLPIVAMPCGVDDAGMPFGIQVVSARGTDYRLLALCAQLERAFASNTELQRPRPSIAKLHQRSK
jgi:Asp-tRNA(Asn)/Glu-tRNA(Gln) amidotransferase A subunit family amidase